MLLSVVFYIPSFVDFHFSGSEIFKLTHYPLSRQDRRSVCSAKFAQAFFEANP